MEFLEALNRVTRAKRNYRRAFTRHINEQTRGEHDLSVKQTRRMALAVASLQRAAFEFTDAKRAIDRINNLGRKS